VSVPMMTRYLEEIIHHLHRLHDEEQAPLLKSARMLADQIKQDKLVYVYGPGGHSNLAAQEIFYRAGGLMHINAMLDEGTLLSNGALRSTAVERTPGYGGMVVADYNLQEGDLLILINAFGINSAVIDAALEAKQRGVKIIGISSVHHAESTPENHPARHPSKKNLHDVVDVVLDSKIAAGDSVLEIVGIDQKVGAMSTFANSYLLNALVAETIHLLSQEGITPPIWMSNNVSGGDDANARFIKQFKGRIKKL